MPGLRESTIDPIALNYRACVVKSHPVPIAPWGKVFPLNLAAGGRPPTGTCGTASPGNRALVSAFVPFVRCSHRDRTKTCRSRWRKKRSMPASTLRLPGCREKMSRIFQDRQQLVQDAWSGSQNRCRCKECRGSRKSPSGDHLSARSPGVRQALFAETKADRTLGSSSATARL